MGVPIRTYTLKRSEPRRKQKMRIGVRGFVRLRQNRNEAPTEASNWFIHPLSPVNLNGLPLLYWRTSKRRPMMGVTRILMPPP